MTLPKHRLPIFDNIKFFLIFLIVYGHVIDQLQENTTFYLLFYQFIYMLHIPALSIISGYLSDDSLSKANISKILLNIGVPYVIFEILYRLFDHFALQDGSMAAYASPPLINPYWLMWYLLSLLTWRLLLPFFSRLPYRFGIALALGFGRGVLFDETSYFAIERSLTFLPYFIAGYELRRLNLIHYIHKTSWWWCLPLVAICFPLMLYQHFPFLMVFGTSGYKALFPTVFIGVQKRAVFYAISFLLCFAFIGLIPKNEKRFLTTLGKNSLSVYLLHGFVILALRSQNVVFQGGRFQSQILGVLLASGLTIFFSTPYVFRFSKYMVQPHRALKTSSK